jgi:hypothetical protein
MTPCTCDMKFPLDTQFTRAASEHPTSAPSSTSDNTCLGLDSFTGLYIRTVKLVRGISIVTSTLRTFTGASSSCSSASSSVEMHLISTPRSGPAPVGNLQRTAVSSLWWSQTGIGPATTPVGIPLLEDQRRPVPKPIARGWFRI